MGYIPSPDMHFEVAVLDCQAVKAGAAEFRNESETLQLNPDFYLFMH